MSERRRLRRAAAVASGALRRSIAALGLVRLPDFFQRMHAPALASTLGRLAGRAGVDRLTSRCSKAGRSLHAWLIVVLLAITAPVTTLLLARAALFRRRQAGDPLPPHPGR